MESLDYWRLCDELNIIQAALLVADCDPSDGHGYVENWEIHARPLGYEAAKTAITSAFRRGTIKGRLIPIYKYDINGNHSGEIDDSINLEESGIEVESLRQWLTNRGFCNGFFFSARADTPEYLNPNNLRYAPKLAAAVIAWQSVTDVKGKHPKQAIAKWLREHAAEFGMTDDEGNCINQAIDDVSKIANWQPTGGAPKTPNE